MDATLEKILAEVTSLKSDMNELKEEIKGLQERKMAEEDKLRGRMTAYAYFVLTYREEQKREQPLEDVVFEEFARKCAERWMTMKEPEKQRFHLLAAEDKKHYESKMSTYVLEERGHCIPLEQAKIAKGDAEPRGRMSAYAYFVQTGREEHKKKHPTENVVFAEFSKKCSERWKTMNEPEKQRFHLMAAKDKKRYETEMSTYVPKEGGPRGKAARKKKDPNAPKRALSAFFHFCQDERPKVKAELGEATVAEVAVELGRKWQDCTDEQKGKYEQLAAKDKQRYEHEMIAYKKGDVYDDDDDEDDDE